MLKASLKHAEGIFFAMLEGARLGRLRNQAQEARHFQIKDFSPYEAIYLFDPEKTGFLKEPGVGIG